MKAKRDVCPPDILLCCCFVRVAPARRVGPRGLDAEAFRDLGCECAAGRPLVAKLSDFGKSDGILKALVLARTTTKMVKSKMVRSKNKPRW